MLMQREGNAREYNAQSFLWILGISRPLIWYTQDREKQRQEEANCGAKGTRESLSRTGIQLTLNVVFTKCQMLFLVLVTAYSSILPTILRARFYNNCPLLVNEETQAQRSYVIMPKITLPGCNELAFESKYPGSRIHTLTTCVKCL